jgi:hypothetical protein
VEFGCGVRAAWRFHFSSMMKIACHLYIMPDQSITTDVTFVLFVRDFFKRHCRLHDDHHDK